MRAPSPVGSAPETVPGAPRSYEDFKAAVLEAQIRGKRAQGKHFFPAVPASELEAVEGHFRMRKAAAQKCRELLKQVRAALDDAKQAGDALAARTERIGIQSAYRDFNQDMAAWEKAFRKYYKKTLSKRESLADGNHGDAAVAVIVAIMRKFKAPPGFSNHSNGTAVDFNTVQDGTKLEALTEQRDAWRASWLHAWLEKHAHEHAFKPLKTEEWHWDYTPAS